MFRNSPPFFMGETYFQEFASIFSWVKNIFRNLHPIFESPELVGTLPQALFFQKNGPHIFTSPELLGTLPQALFFRKMPPPYLGGFFLELFAIAESETLMCLAKDHWSRLQGGSTKDKAGA